MNAMVPLQTPVRGLGPIPSMDMLRAERARRKLHYFFREFAWPVLQPATKFVDNWHIGAICEHLEAVTRGEIKRLIVNMPFRMLKSSIVSQAFPAWEWIDHPALQYLTTSYAKDVATRDAVASRRIIESEAYRKSWGDKFRMTSDQNVKTRYENNKTGTRTISSTDGAATGFGGNRIILDDPISAKEADNEVAREASIEYYKGTVATRLNNAQEDSIILTHQRLNERDLTGYLISEETGWTHLILPMRFEKKYSFPTTIGFRDPRSEEGELLCPQRLNDETVKQMESTLGSYHTAAQLQQRPDRRGGTIIHGHWFKRYKTLPLIKYREIFADTAQKTKEHNDYSVFECWGYGVDGKIYLIDLIRGKWEAPELKRRAKEFWKKHLDLTDYHANGQLRRMVVEDKSSGTGLIQEIKAEGNIPIFGLEHDRDKYLRVTDVVSHIEAGLVCIPEDAPFTSDFVAENEAFTSNDTHPHDDQIDPMVDAITSMLGKANLIDLWTRLGKR